MSNFVVGLKFFAVTFLALMFCTVVLGQLEGIVVTRQILTFCLVISLVIGAVSAFALWLGLWLNKHVTV
jgi:hypothetical protein